MVDPVLEFLPCRTPEAWTTYAVSDLPILLLDHASLELRAAEQAQKLLRRYGARKGDVGAKEGPGLLYRMSRLAREELRHFEQVLAILQDRGIPFEPISASRYASALHQLVRTREPGRLIDTLIVGAVIEARSCERFFCLIPALEREAPDLAAFYSSLLKSEARHFQDYLTLAEGASEEPIFDRIDLILELERDLVVSTDSQFRFHSGVPESALQGSGA